MRNFEKFKTAQSAAKAYFENKKQTSFFDGDFCEKFKQFIAWLNLEAEEEKPLPCPFCGNTMMHKHDEFADPKVFVVCPNCGYRSRWEFNLGVAIAAHNRVAKAVRESEAK